MPRVLSPTSALHRRLVDTLHDIPGPSTYLPRLSIRVPIAVVLSVLICTANSSANPPSFMGLGFLPGDIVSDASDITADGSIVVGASYNSFLDREEAIRWTANGGMVGLGPIPGGAFSYATSVSDNGTVIAGISANDSESYHAFHWTKGGNALDIGRLPGDDQAAAADLSADGSVIAGSSWSADYSHAFRWTEPGGMTDLGHLPGCNNTRASGISADGSALAGESYSVNQYGIAIGEAYRWTQETGLTGIGHLPGGNFSSASAISRDGSVVVGYSKYAGWGYFQGFRWTQETGMTGLGLLPNSPYGSVSFANDVSDDGSIIVGAQVGGYVYDQAIYWTQTNGVRRLQDILTNDFGLDLSGWTLEWASGVSADGLTIVGNGTHLGRTEAYIAHLPEPATALLSLTVAVFRRRRIFVNTA